MFSPGLFKLLHLQSKNIYKHIKTHKKLLEKHKHKKQTEIHYFPAGT